MLTPCILEPAGNGTWQCVSDQPGHTHHGVITTIGTVDGLVLKPIR